jgi:hypothetical protein
VAGEAGRVNRAERAAQSGSLTPAEHANLAPARSLLRRHFLFAAALVAGLALRVGVMVGFPQPIWFGGDSASYLSTALRLVPDKSRLAGYGLMLAVLRPFHSFALVTTIQHLMGLAMAVMLYAVLRRYGLPAWGATLASLPVLLGAYEIALEHDILPSAPFAFLIMLAVTLVVWWRGERPAWATIGAGLVLAGAATWWPVGLPLLIVYLIYLLVRRTGWRTLAATVAAGAVPLAGYLLWFDLAYHQVAFSDSDGIFLWSRTMSFANCAVIKPPPAEAGLCTSQPVARRPAASTFIWEPNSPLGRLPGPRFSPHKNALALDFALRAIAAQPAGYAGAVLHDFMLSFAWGIPAHPSKWEPRRYQFSYATHPWISPNFAVAPGHTVASDQRAYGAVTGTRAVQPVAGWLAAYQRFVYLRGTLLGGVMLIGLGGIVRCWRRGGIRRLRGWGGPGLFPWFTALLLLLVPVATADYSKRYVVIAVPVACLAAGLAFSRRECPGTQPVCWSPAATPLSDAGAATRPHGP